MELVASESMVPVDQVDCMTVVCILPALPAFQSLRVAMENKL